MNQQELHPQEPMRGHKVHYFLYQIIYILVKENPCAMTTSFKIINSPIRLHPNQVSIKKG